MVDLCSRRSTISKWSSTAPVTGRAPAVQSTTSQVCIDALQSTSCNFQCHVSNQLTGRQGKHSAKHIGDYISDPQAFSSAVHCLQF